MIDLAAYAVVGAVAVVTTLIATPMVRRVAINIDAVVKPDERRVHERPTPTLGGIAMLMGLFAGMATAWQLDAFDEIFSGSTEPLGIVLAATLIVVIGVVDDLREVSAPAKTAGMVLAASILVIGGTSILVLRVPFLGTFLLSADWSYLISVIWVVGMANVINIIDGLDGLAAGIVAIAAAAFFIYSVQLADAGLLQAGNAGPLVAVIVLAMCLGFLPFNVHPARIFMGDCGALLLGLLMAASTMVVGGRTDQPFSGQSFFFYAPLLIPLLVLAVPIFDTAFAIVRRARRRKGLATADKDHLHHRLMRIGHGHWRSVLILWAWTALLSGLVLFPTITGRGNAFVPIGILALALLLFTVLHPTWSSRRSEADPSPDQTSAADKAAEGDDATVVDLTKRRSG
jgi:UDP-GlcNAc:undecaprenyl-phosphate GlcNAc-1-phosphate transferase